MLFKINFFIFSNSFGEVAFMWLQKLSIEGFLCKISKQDLDLYLQSMSSVKY